ncbi:MAG: hypothetical protein WBK55_08100 [Alphaproteobacteria bacterium]
MTGTNPHHCLCEQLTAGLANDNGLPAHEIVIALAYILIMFWSQRQATTKEEVLQLCRPQGISIELLEKNWLNAETTAKFIARSTRLPIPSATVEAAGA